MATEVFTTEVIRLQDEAEVELRPLPIAKLRKFMRMWSDHLNEIGKKLAEQTEREKEEGDDTPDFTQADLTDAQLTVFIKMCALGLESQLKGEKTDKQFLAYLEDVLDEPTIHKILDLTGGLKLNDPNQSPAATNLAGAGTI